MVSWLDFSEYHMVVFGSDNRPFGIMHIIIFKYTNMNWQLVLLMYLLKLYNAFN